MVESCILDEDGSAGGDGLGAGEEEFDGRWTN